MISEIRKEAKAYAFRNDGCGYDLNTCEDIFSDGAEWMQELMIQKACEWLSKNTYSIFIQSCTLNQAVDRFVNDFKQAMKGDEQ